MASALTEPTTSGGTLIMTRAMDPEVADAIWEAIEPIFRSLSTITRSAATTHGFRTGSASAGS
jgi:hypothetical protein